MVLVLRVSKFDLDLNSFALRLGLNSELILFDLNQKF